MCCSAGDGAERFAREQGLALEEPSYFATEKRLSALKRNLKYHHGTVGAVALDQDGNLAAATSTGGYTGKLPGRIGDSPLIGAGNYADNRACAVSGTGLGEAFIRAAVAYDVAARMRYRKEALGEGRGRGARQCGPARRRWRADRGRPARQRGDAVQQRRDVPRLDRPPRQDDDRDFY